MPNSAALTIWVASSQIALPITGAVARAAGEILGPSVTVQTAAYPDAHPDAVRPPGGGERSVQVAWVSERFEGARLRLCRAANDCFERWVAFHEDDPVLERGRTVGFLASAAFLEGAPPTPASAASPPVPLVPPQRRGTASAALVAAGPGDGAGLGGRFAADYAFFEPLRLGLALQTRFGELPAAQATSRLSSLDVTLNLTLAEPTRALWLGLAADAGVHQLFVSHLSQDDPEPDRQARWLFGGDLLVELGLNMNDLAALVVAPGVELLSGKTEVVVHGQTRATWPVAIPLLRFGIRAAF